MPLREYICRDDKQSCAFCKSGFEQLEKIDQQALDVCPRCGSPVERRISPPSFGVSKSGLDDRARRAGFHKLKKLGRGEYEKQY
jgi:putative FmdB family regulatory protein